MNTGVPHRLRFGILSTARIGRHSIAPAIQASRNAELVAVASRDMGKAGDFAKEALIPRHYGSYEALLDDPGIEAVYVPLPNSLHREWAIKAAEKKKHVLCEKPLALSVAEGLEMQAAADKNGVRLMEAFMYRFHHRTQRLIEMTHSGTVGDLRVIRSAFTFRLTRPDNIRLREDLGGGALLDVGCYCVDLSRRLAGTLPVEAQAWATTGPTGVDTQLAGSLRFESGLVAQFDCALDVERREFVEVVGTDGTLFAGQAFVSGPGNVEIVERHGRGAEVRHAFAGEDSYQRMVEHFGDAVLADEPVRYGVADATGTMAIIEALQRSAAASGEPMPVEDQVQMSEGSKVTVLIASYLEPEHVERILKVDPRVDVIYEPDLLRKPRYAADHNGVPVPRSSADEARWRSLLAKADVLFDFDYTNDADLPELAPRVRWIQASSAGIGQFVARRRYHERMKGTIFTTARGVHAVPLAEFCALAMLGFSRGLFRMHDLQGRKHWERFAGTDLVGRTVVIFGHGAIGREVARLARAFGMSALGVKRSVAGETPEAHNVDELHPASALRTILPRAEFLVLAAPHTKETEGVLGVEELRLLPAGAVLINIGRGALVDEPAMIEALRSGHLGGAALDVFATEPLPPDSPLWTMPNVLVSPHSASTSDRENGRLTELFCDNLRRFLMGEPLRNVLDTERLY